jgi:hypothetical protein
MYEIQVNGRGYEVEADSPDQLQAAHDQIAQYQASQEEQAEAAAPEEEKSVGALGSAIWDKVTEFATNSPTLNTLGSAITSVPDSYKTLQNIASSVVAEPVAGLAGIAGSALGDVDTGVNWMNNTRDALTVHEDDSAVQENLSAIGDSAVGQLAQGYDNTTTGWADSVYDMTGSPGLAAATKTAPDALLEFMGLGGVRKAKNLGKGITNHLDRPEVQRLRDMGVQPTVGQTVGGAANALEERLTGILPGVASARSRAIDEFQLGTLNKAMEPLGVKIDQIGVEGIEQAQRAVDGVYDSARAAMPEMEITDSLYGDVAEILSDFSNSANASDSIKRVDTIIENNVMPMLDRGNATGATVKNVDASLNKIIESSDVPEIKNALREIQHRIRREAASQSPEYAALVSKADAAYSGLAAIEKAAGSAGVDGVFTPAQLKRAAKDKASRREKARGGRGPMAEPAGDAVSVLGNKIPDSGTAARMGVYAGAGGGLGYTVSPAIPAGMLAAYLGSTRPMQVGANAVLRNAVPVGARGVGGGMMALPIAAQMGEAKEREEN